MSKLVELLQRLGADAKLASAYEENPDAVMQEAGLSDEEREVLKSGDIEKIREATGLKELERTNIIIRAYDK